MVTVRERVRIFTPELQLRTRTGQGYNSASEAEARVGRPRPSSVPQFSYNHCEPSHVTAYCYMIVIEQFGRRAPGSPRSGPARGGGWRARAPRHRAGHAGTQPGPARGARGPGANLLDLDLDLDLGRRVLVVRKAERAVRCGSKRDASAGRHGRRRRERRGRRGAARGRRLAGD